MRAACNLGIEKAEMRAGEGIAQASWLPTLARLVSSEFSGKTLTLEIKRRVIINPHMYAHTYTRAYTTGQRLTQTNLKLIQILI